MKEKEREKRKKVEKEKKERRKKEERKSCYETCGSNYIQFSTLQSEFSSFSSRCVVPDSLALI